MTIKQLLDMPIGDETSGTFVLQVAHTHKMTKLLPDGWQHDVTLTDGTDEIRACVVLKKNRKFCRLDEIRVKDCEIIAESDGGYGKKLLVHEHERITYSADQLDEPRLIEQQNAPKNRWDAINRGKVKHGLLCACIESGTNIYELDLSHVAKLADWVMSPEDKWDG
jgi:Fe-S-cluster containining protein